MQNEHIYIYHNRHQKVFNNHFICENNEIRFLDMEECVNIFGAFKIALNNNK